MFDIPWSVPTTVKLLKLAKINSRLVLTGFASVRVNESSQGDHTEDH